MVGILASFGMAYFQGQTVSLREGRFQPFRFQERVSRFVLNSSIVPHQTITVSKLFC